MTSDKKKIAKQRAEIKSLEGAVDCARRDLNEYREAFYTQKEVSQNHLDTIKGFLAERKMYQHQIQLLQVEIEYLKGKK